MATQLAGHSPATTQQKPYFSRKHVTRDFFSAHHGFSDFRTKK